MELNIGVWKWDQVREFQIAAGRQQKTDTEKVIESLSLQNTVIREQSADQIKSVKLVSDNAIEAAQHRHDMQIEWLTEAHEEDSEWLAGLLSAGERQIIALNQLGMAIGGGMMSISDAISGLRSAFDRPSIVNPFTVNGRSPFGGRTQSASSFGGPASIRGFARGGDHDGGIRVVGGNGPELEMTGRSRIMSNNDSKKLLSFDELIAELRDMKREAKLVNTANAKNTMKMAKLLDRWDGDGMPPERTP